MIGLMIRETPITHPQTSSMIMLENTTSLMTLRPHPIPSTIPAPMDFLTLHGHARAMPRGKEKGTNPILRTSARSNTMSRKHKPEEKKMRRRIRLLPIAGFFIAFLAIIAQGLTFYNGPITLSSVDGMYSLSGEPKASITYVFSGNGQVTLDFPGIPSDALILIDGIESSRPAQIMVDGSKSLSIAY